MAERERRGHGYGALAAGFVLVVVGFALILYEMWVASASFPLNTYTYVGIFIAGLGVAFAAIGFDRGERRK
jgi:predicted tellurium resistance membrane protein TerC